MLSNQSEIVTIIEAVILIIILISCLIGNSMMCLVIFKYRGPKSRTYRLLGNLAIADLGLGLFCMPFTIVTLISRQWILGSFLCNFNGFMNAFWIPATVFATTSITIHKCHSLHDPFNPRRTWNRVRVFVTVTWLLSLICAIGPLCGWHNYGYNQLSSQCGLAAPKTTKDYSYMVFLAVAVYSIPMLLNVICFILLFRAVRKHVVRLGHNAILSQSRTIAQKRTAVTFLMIFVSYVISWTPFFIFGLLKVAGAKRDLAGQYLTVAYMLGFSNTVHNPIIFAFRNETFRESFKEIILSICGRYRRKLRTITNTTLTSNFSFQIFQRSDSGFGSAWYVDTSEINGDASELGFQNATMSLDGEEDVVLHAMRRHHHDFISQENLNTFIA